MKLWIVGKMVDCTGCEKSWLSNGIFDSEKKAIAACITDDYFVAPMVLNEHRGDEKQGKWKGCYYPLVETQEEAHTRVFGERIND